MNMPHVIEQAVLDIGFDSEDEAFAQQPVLSAFMKSRLTSVIDEVFSEFSSTDMVLKIDCLVVDLGTIVNTDLLDVMTERFREQLRSALREQLQVLTTGFSGKGSLISQDRSACQQIEHFLLTGHMPWHALLGQDRAVEEMFLRVIQSSSESLTHFLKRSARRGTIIKRLVSQFREAILADLLRALVSSHASVLLSCMDDIRSMMRQHHFVDVTEKELDKFMWERLLDEILSSQGAEGVPHSWVGRIVTQMARRYGSDATLLLTQLSEQAVQLEQTAGRRAGLSRVLQVFLKRRENEQRERSNGLSVRERGHGLGLDARQGGAAGPRTGDRAISEIEQPGVEQWWKSVMKALEQGDAADLAAHWPRLLREQTTRLLDILRYEGQRAETRRRLAQGWPEHMLLDLITLLEPGAERFIAGIFDCPELLTPIPGRSSEPLTRRQLWEFTLTYLLVERGSPFNRRAYLGALIQQMATYDNLSAQELLESVTLQFNVAGATRLIRELQQLLNELREEWGRGLPTPFDPGLQSQAVIHAYDLYDRLRMRLLQDVEPSTGVHPAGDLTILLESLRQVAPWQLQRLVRELQAGAFPWPPIATRLSTVELRQFLKVVLICLRPTDEEGCADILRSVDISAGRTNTSQRFYRHVIESLLRDQVLDMEAIFGKIRPANEAGHTSEHTQTQLQSGDAARLSVESVAALKSADWLERDLAAAVQAFDGLSAEASVQLIQRLDVAFAEKPDRLRSVLESIVRTGPTASRLIALLPDRLLTRVLWLLKPAVHDQAQKVIDLLAIAAACAEPGLGYKRLRRTTWQFLFKYLIEESRSFIIGPFVRGFAIYLAEETHQPHAVVTQALLRRQLENWRLPAIQGLSGVMGMELFSTTEERAARDFEEEKRTGSDRATARQEAPLVPTSMDASWRWVLKALEHGNVAEHAAYWPRLLQEQAGRLRDFLRQEGRRAEIRRRVAQGWPEPMFQDVVRLFEPGAQRFIGEVIGGLELRQSIPIESSEASNRHRRRLWEFTLTYLLVEQSGQFDKRAYLGSLIRQTAAHDNVAAQDVLQALSLQRIPTMTTTGLTRDLQQLLGELTAEWESRPPVSGKVAPRSVAMIHAYDRFDELRARLLEGIGVDSPGPLNALLDSLLREAPWLLLRFARELQAWDFSTLPWQSRLSAVAWRTFFTTLLGRLASVNPEEWIRTLDQYAGQVRDFPRFYGNMLEQLLHGKKLNREALFPTTSAAQVGDDQSELKEPPRKIDSAPPVTGTPEPGHHQTEAEWLAALQAPGPLSVGDITRMAYTLDQLFVSSSDRLRPLIESLFTDRETAARLIARLPERLLTRLLYLLRPAVHAQAQRVADLLVAAGTGAERTLDPTSLRRVTWELLFRYLIEEGRPFDLDTFVHRFVATLADQSSQPDISSVRARLRLHLTHQSPPTNSIDHRTLAALSSAPDEEARPSAPTMSDHDVLDDDESVTEQIYIANAGQVLAAPFLPRLFAMLNLTEGAVFTGRQAAERAVHILQFMVNERIDSPEYQLVLNKILCGVKTGAPIERTIDIDTGEREAIEGMLRGMMQHWTVLGNTSIAGFRESFLQREGRLRLQDNTWHLLVEARSFDMLLDQIPWSFATIKFPWMERVLYVEWR